MVVYMATKLERELKGMLAQQNTVRAKRLSLRLHELFGANTLADLGPPLSGPARCHELVGGESHNLHHISVDLEHPYRLIFVPEHDPLPFREEGGLDWSRVTAITILGVEDTHG